jgi:hypothetical protein
LSALVASSGQLLLSGVIVKPDGSHFPLDLRTRRLSFGGWRRFFPCELTHDQATRNVLADAVVDRIDLGSTNTEGSVKIYTANYLDLLATVVMANPAFGAAANGVAQGLSLPWSDASAAADGIPTKFIVTDRDENPVIYGDIGASDELTFQNYEINTNDIVKILTASYTAPP